MKSSDYRYGNVIPVPGIVRYTAGPTAPERINCPAKGIVNGAPLFVRVGQSGLIQTSPDLVTWTTRTSGVSVMLNSVAWIARLGVFVAVGSTNTILTSPDGVGWTAKTSPTSAGWNGLGDNGSYTVIVGSGGNTLKTVDFETFTTGTVFGTSAPISDVAWNGTTWLAACQSFSPVGRAVYARSTTGGGSWARTDIETGRSVSLPLYSVVWDGTSAIAAGRDGLIITINAAGTSYTVRESGTTQELRVFLANGKLYGVGENGISIESSDGGETWQPGPPIGTTEFMRYGIDTGDSKTALVVGDAGIMRLGEYGAKIGAYTNNTDRTNDQSGKYSEPFSFAETPKAGVKITIP